MSTGYWEIDYFFVKSDSVEIVTVNAPALSLKMKSLMPRNNLPSLGMTMGVRVFPMGNGLPL